jgi:hypothetical protein
MTSQDRDYEDIVRRALHTAAESVEPAGDGLERIRHRLHSPRSAASVLSGFTLWCRLHGIRFLVRLEPAIGAARSGRGQVRHLLGGLGPLPGPLLALFGGRRGRPGEPGHDQAGHPPGGEGGPPERPRRGPLGPGAAWLRPVLAVSAVVVVVVVGVFALHRAQETFQPSNSVTSPGASQPNGGATAPSADASPGLWSLPIGVQTKPPVTAKSRKKGVTTVLPAVACTPAPSPIPSTASPSASATPTPTGTTTPTPTPTDTTPTPTPTPTDTSSPTASPTGIASTSARTTAVITMATPGAFAQAVLVRCGTGTMAPPKTS